jgi:hypothetical protein
MTCRVLLAAALTFALNTNATAQIRASELGATQQTIDGTKITIEYSRPAVRGRTPFGGIVHWGEKWTPGANWATTFEVDRDIKLAGQAVPKGKYTVYVIPQQNADWTFILHRNPRAYHVLRPDTVNELLRVAVKPQQAAHLERLTFTFPTVTPEGGVLQFHWGTTSFELPIRVQPSRPIALDSATMQLYVGSYQYDWRGRPVTMDVFVENNKLRARTTPVTLPYEQTFDLVPTTKHRFAGLFYRSGEPFDLEDFVIMFDIPQSGNATAVAWLGIADQPIAKGSRIK